MVRQIKSEGFRFSASPGCRIRHRGRHHPGRRQRLRHVRKKQLLHGVRNFIRVRQQLADLPNLRIRQFGLKCRHSGQANPVGRLPVAL